MNAEVDFGEPGDDPPEELANHVADQVQPTPSGSAEWKT